MKSEAYLSQLLQQTPFLSSQYFFSIQGQLWLLLQFSVFKRKRKKKHLASQKSFPICFSSFPIGEIGIGDLINKDESSHIPLTTEIYIFFQTYLDLSTPEKQKRQCWHPVESWLLNTRHFLYSFWSHLRLWIWPCLCPSQGAECSLWCSQHCPAILEKGIKGLTSFPFRPLQWCFQRK